MKQKRLRGLIRAVIEEDRLSLAPVTVRTLTVCFKDRSVDLDGRRITTESDCLVIPILSGDAVFISRGDLERLG